MKSLQVFNFNGTYLDYAILDDEPLFNLNNVASILDISNPRTSINTDDVDYVLKLDSSVVGLTYNRNLNNRGELFLTEAGLYRLIMSSKKKEAEAFQKWVVKDVLPSIRKTGSYSISTDPMHSSFNGERITLTFEGTALTIILSDKHGFYISAKDIDRGYALYNHATRRILRNNQEFIKGTDYITAGDDLECLSGYRSWQIFLTKKCAINISKYIKTNKALSFKNWLLSIDLSTIANCGTRGSPSYNKGIDIEEAKALAYLIYKGISKDINKDDLLHSSIKTLANKLNNSLNIIK